MAAEREDGHVVFLENPRTLSDAEASRLHPVLLEGHLHVDVRTFLTVHQRGHAYEASPDLELRGLRDVEAEGRHLRGELLVNVGPISDLSDAIRAPAVHGAARLERAAVEISNRHGDDRSQRHQVR